MLSRWACPGSRGVRREAAGGDGAEAGVGPGGPPAARSGRRVPGPRPASPRLPQLSGPAGAAGRPGCAESRSAAALGKAKVEAPGVGVGVGAALRGAPCSSRGAATHALCPPSPPRRPWRDAANTKHRKAESGRILCFCCVSAYFRLNSTSIIQMITHLETLIDSWGLWSRTEPVQVAPLN